MMKKADITALKKLMVKPSVTDHRPLIAYVMPDCPNNVMKPETYCAPHYYAVMHVKNSKGKV